MANSVYLAGVARLIVGVPEYLVTRTELAF